MLLKTRFEFIFGRYKHIKGLLQEATPVEINCRRQFYTDVGLRARASDA